MDIKLVLGKVRDGEELTEEEKAFLADYDHDKVMNDAAAAARRRAEARAAEAEKERATLQETLAELQAKIDEAETAGKSDVEQLQANMDKLAARLAERDKELDEARAANAKMARDTKIREIQSAAGIAFVDGVDGTVMSGAFASAFADLDDADLGDETVTKPIIDGFRNANKAVIADKSGVGSGGNPHDGTGPAAPVGESDPEKMTTEERAADLKKRGLL